MRQGCRDTLEALHTEQTTWKILQKMVWLIQIEEFPIKRFDTS